VRASQRTPSGETNAQRPPSRRHTASRTERATRRARFFGRRAARALPAERDLLSRGIARAPDQQGFQPAVGTPPEQPGGQFQLLEKARPRPKTYRITPGASTWIESRFRNTPSRGGIAGLDGGEGCPSSLRSPGPCGILLAIRPRFGMALRYVPDPKVPLPLPQRIPSEPRRRPAGASKEPVGASAMATNASSA